MRLELRQQPDGTTVLVAAQSWLIDAQVPEKLPAVMFNTCADLTKYLSANAPTVDVISTRHFLDVGDKITLTGAGKTIELDRNMMLADFRNQVEGILYANNAKVQGTVDPSLVTPGTEFQIAFGNGMNPSDTLYVPNAWTPVSGPKFDGSVHTIAKTQDFVVQFNSPDDKTKANISFLIFLPDDKMSKWACFGDNTGTITMPAANLSSIGPTGVIWVGTVRHKPINYNSRNLDLLGTNCKQQKYSIQ